MANFYSFTRVRVDACYVFQLKEKVEFFFFFSISIIYVKKLFPLILQLCSLVDRAWF